MNTKTTRRAKPFTGVQSLEPRRLMSFTAIGRESELPINGLYQSYDVAVADDGTSYVAVVNTTRSPSLGRDVTVLSVQKYDSMGRWAGPLTVMSRYIQPGAGVAIAATSDGEAAVAYVERRGSVETLRMQRLNTGGEGFDAGRQIFQKPVTTGDQAQFSAFGHIAMSMADNGEIYVAHRGTDSNDLVVQHLSSAGDTSPDVIAALDNDAAAYEVLVQFDIDARSDDSGAMFIASVQGNGGELIQGPVTRTARGTESRVIMSGQDPADPAIAILTGGGHVITYSDNTQADSFGAASVTAKRFGAGGNALGAEIGLEDGLVSPPDSPAEAGHSSVEATPDGGFVATFVQYGIADSGVKVGPAYARRYAADGTADESGAVVLGTSNLNSTAIDVDAYGNALAVYAKPGADGVNNAPAETVGFRRLTSGIIVHQRELYAIGTSGNDVIRVDEAANASDRVRVTVNGQTRRLPFGYVGAISILGLDGNDRIDVNHRAPATISGGADNDTILGSAEADSIRGDSGNDRLYGNGGNDILDGGSNSDFLRGGQGNDQLFGGVGAGNDVLYGDSGNDTFNGGLGIDRLFGGDDDDVAVRDAADIVDGVERV